jgi:hypothetical protein
MKTLGWNCQGAGRVLGNPKLCHLARMVIATKPQVIFVSETKNSKFTSAQISSRFNMHDSIVVPAHRRTGGLWLLWSDDVEVSVHSASLHLILALVTDRSKNQKFGLVCIYGDPYHRLSATIWQQIANFVYVNSNLPMLCIGDMNDILYASDKSSPNINRRRVDAFHSAIKNCGLFDVSFSGPAYTWTNHHFTSNPLFQRLDRYLVNHDWCATYPITNVYNMPLMRSCPYPSLYIW